VQKLVFKTPSFDKFVPGGCRKFVQSSTTQSQIVAFCRNLAGKWVMDPRKPRNSETPLPGKSKMAKVPEFSICKSP